MPIYASMYPVPYRFYEVAEHLSRCPLDIWQKNTRHPFLITVLPVPSAANSTLWRLNDRLIDRSGFTPPGVLPSVHNCTLWTWILNIGINIQRRPTSFTDSTTSLGPSMTSLYFCCRDQTATDHPLSVPPGQSKWIVYRVLRWESPIRGELLNEVAWFNGLVVIYFRKFSIRKIIILLQYWK